MENMDFDGLFDSPAEDGGFASGLLQSLFGNIIQRLRGDEGVEVQNWLSDIFLVFNSVFWIGVVIVFSYTIYSAIFDTAADGTTFGQRTSARYTMLRTVIGLILFAPISGGFSVLQVVFLWIVLQGSALGDVGWSTMANNMLSGTPLLSTTGRTIPVNVAEQQRNFGQAFDAMVLGHLCALNANRIAGVIGTNGTPNGRAPIDTMVPLATFEDHNKGLGELRLVNSNEAHRSKPKMIGSPLDDENLWVDLLETEVELSHTAYFQEADGKAFNKRANYCGGVQAHDSYNEYSSDAAQTYRDVLLNERTKGQFAAYVSLMQELSRDARDVAHRIYEGNLNGEEIIAESRNAVRQATGSFLSGPAMSPSSSYDQVVQFHSSLLDEATTEGWLFAPVWLRGVAMAASSAEMPGTNIQMEVFRESRIADYLANRGLRTGGLMGGSDPVSGEMLAKAESDAQIWEAYRTSVTDFAVPSEEGEEPNLYSSATAGADSGVLRDAVNYIRRMIMSTFDPEQQTPGNAGFVDPMIQTTQQGMLMVQSGGGLAVGGSFISIFSDIPFVGEAVGEAAGALVSLGTTLFFAGLIMVVILPLIPMVFFYSSVLTWLVMVFEGLIALPLMALSLFAPSRDDSLVGNQVSMLLTVLGVFLRPLFTVAGLLFAMMIIAAGLFFLNTIFNKLLGFTQVGDGFIVTVIMVGTVVMYVIMSALTVWQVSQLITEVGDRAMDAIGARVSRYAQSEGIAEKASGSRIATYGGASSAGAIASRVSGAAGRNIKGTEGAKRIAHRGRKLLQ